MAVLCLQIVDNLIDAWWRYHRSADRRVVVADRCIYDTLVDLAVDTGLDDVVFGRLGQRLVRLLPAPRLVVVLDRPVAAIRATRPDVLSGPQFRPPARALPAPRAGVRAAGAGQ